MSMFPDERGLGEWLSNLPAKDVSMTPWATANGRLIGPPKATEAYSVEQMESFGLVGIYEQPEDGKIVDKSLK